MLLRIAADFVCPYCGYLVTQLQKARPTHPDLEVEYLPYTLRLPEEGPVDTYHSPEHRDKYQRTLGPLCEEQGLGLMLPPPIVPRPFTQLAYEGFHFARELGLSTPYFETVILAYFREGLDIGKLDVLCELARRVGLPVEDFKQGVETGKYALEHRTEAQKNRQNLGIHVIPTVFAPDGRRVEGFIRSFAELEPLLTPET